MLEAAFWGLVQGLSEFLPISSRGHLVIVPAALDMEAPDLAITALHLGTLAAVLAYYRRDVVRMVRLRDDGRRIVGLVVAGTIPAAVLGLPFETQRLGRESRRSSHPVTGVSSARACRTGASRSSTRRYCDTSQ